MRRIVGRSGLADIIAARREGAMSREMARRRSCLAHWAGEDQAFAAAGVTLDVFAGLLGDAEDAFDAGDVAPFGQLLDLAEEKGLLPGLVEESRRALTQIP